MKKAAVDAALLPPIITDKVMTVIWGIKRPHFLLFYQNPILFHEAGCFVYQELFAKILLLMFFNVS
jgi:hypothetical protein